MTEKKEKKPTDWQGIVVALITAVLGPVIVILIGRAVERADTQPTITPSAVVAQITDAPTAKVNTQVSDPTVPSVRAVVTLTPKPATPKQAPTRSAGPVPTSTGEWQKLDDLPRTVNDFLVDPHNSNVIYAATGDYASSGSGLYKSDDAGVTWRNVTNKLPNISVVALGYVSDTDWLYALFMGGDLYASNDGATTWERMSKVELSLTIKQRINSMPANKSLYIVGSRTGLLRSDDGGRAWNPMSKGLPTNTNGECEVLSLAMGYSNATNVIYIGLTGRGVYKSEDAGETWTPANKKILDYDITTLEIQSDDAQTVWAATQDSELLVSHDGGLTWENATDRLPKSPFGRTPIRNISNCSGIKAGFQ